ncbi:MAG TPA: hypothetical protein VIV84_03910 [Burkholderiaceae bacterium]
MWQPIATGGGTEFDQPSPNTLSNATIYDDLTAIGASATYQGNTYSINGVPQPGSLALWTGAPPNVSDPIVGDGTKRIVFSYANNPALANIPAGTRIQVQMTVVLDDVPANTPGKTFTNTAKWWFGRVVGGVAYEPLPGESGVSPPMTIVEPGLTLQKAGSQSNLNVGTEATFRLDVQNTGGGDAWNATVTDLLPSGMRAFDPTPTVTAALYAADGTTQLAPLTAGTHYTVSYSSATGELRLTLADAVKLAPTQRLIVTYRAKLDAGLAQGVTLTNVAGATRWFNAAAGATSRRQYDRTLTGGTPGVLDFQDAYTVTSTIQGYFFLKSVGNLTTGTPVATTASPGDRLRYTLQIQNFTLPPLGSITVTDDLDALNAAAAFVPGSLALASSNLPGGVTLTLNPTGGSKGTGSVTINGLNLPTDLQYQVQFDVTLASALANGTVLNRGQLSGVDNAGKTWAGGSDDPHVNGPAQLGAPGSDPTAVQVFSPSGLTKANTQATATIGQRFKYRLTVPATPVNVPLYDVRLLDNLGASAAKLGFVGASVVSGGSWSLSNTGSATNLVIQDTATGIDIPAGGQAVIEITVVLQNDATNRNGLQFANTASYTYNKINGSNLTQSSGGAGASGPMTVVEPALTIAKAVRYAAPAGKAASTPVAVGDVLQYTVTATNNGAATAYDADVLDLLPANLSLVAGSATATINGVAVSSFVAQPTVLPNGALVWGALNGDPLLDIPVGGTLVLSYRANVLSVTGAPITNSAYAAWGSLDSGVGGERNGVGCPNATAPNTYCTGPATSTMAAPVLQVSKVSQDMTGDAAVLRAGDRLRYTLTVKNVGTEKAVGVSLRDLVPANTSYVAGSTTQNGAAVPDAAGGGSPLQAGLLIHAPGDATPGVLRADASAATSNVATVVFDVVINAGVLDGTLISNQGFVNGSGEGSGVFAEVPSDDPRTPAVNDPTRDIVGPYPLLVTRKTVTLVRDGNGNGVLDPFDVIRYTIRIDNLSGLAATGVVLNDPTPANTAYVADTVTLNGAPVASPDGGVSPLAAGIGVNSPSAASGTVAPRASAEISFDVRVNSGVPAGTVISNQGSLASTELPSQLTDADGDSSNGYQPTTIIVGSAQQVAITKAVQVVGGGAALPGAQLEYLVTATNTGAAAATQLVLTDDLGTAPLASQVSYVAGSAMLNGAAAGVSVSGALLRADYAAVYGNLAPGASVQLRFRAQIAADLPLGTSITNTAQVAWNSPALTASAGATIAVGGIPGAATLHGRVWHDTDLDKQADTSEAPVQGWAVEVLRNNVLLGSVTTDANGQYVVNGLSPSATAADQFSLRFTAPDAGAQTAKLGRADSAFINGMQSISGVTAPSGSNLQNLNLPLQPNGVAYNSIVRTPVMGAALTMVRAGSTVPLPSACFDDPVQQGQVTLANGYYKFDLNFGDPSCPSGGTYLIQLAAPAAYTPGVSRVIPPVSHVDTVSFSVPGCPGTSADAVTATGNHCEAQASEFAPGVAVPAGSVATNHYLNLTFNSGGMPGTSQIYNNHIAIDPRLGNAVTIAKVAALQNVTRGQLVPYTITVTNTLPVTLPRLSVIDTFPAGFKYVPGSGRIDGQSIEPTAVGNQLTWSNLQLATNTKRVIQLMLIIGSGVSEGLYVNRAQVFAPQLDNSAASSEATATVRVVADPTFDCSDVIGKVFDDVNMNGYQDDGETGLPGVRLVTARGLIVTTDAYGRFHLTCAVVPDPDRGSNFIVKLDDRSLPTGYRITTENPRVQRVTRGKMIKFDFGATLHRVVRLDIADGVFEPGTVEMRIQWKQRMKLLQGELKKTTSLLRLSYLAEIESESLVKQRLETLKREIAAAWKSEGAPYDLTVETEVFWRTGAPR